MRESIEGGEAEGTHEAGRGLLVAGGDVVPLLEFGPEAFDLAAFFVDTIQPDHRRFVELRRDRSPSAHNQDVLAEDVTGVAAVPKNPFAPQQLSSRGTA